MAYRIPKRRAPVAPAVDLFPALCPKVQTALPVLDFTKLSFEEEEVIIPEKRFEPGWVRLSREHGKLKMETDYYAPEPNVNVLMSKEILRMKARWTKFYTDRGLEPYNYDYEPYEVIDDYSSEEGSTIGEDPDDYDSE
jgi:hypothetical protein